jgi:hypothetical protein
MGFEHVLTPRVWLIEHGVPFLSDACVCLAWRRGFVPDLLSFVRNQPAPHRPGAGFRLGIMGIVSQQLTQLPGGQKVCNRAGRPLKSKGAFISFFRFAK